MTLLFLTGLIADNILSIRDKMIKAEVIDLRISKDLLESFNDVVKGYENKNVTESRLLDIGLTILLSDEESKESIFSNANQRQLEIEGSTERKTFRIRNESVVSAIKEVSMFRKKFVVEYGMYYIINRLQTADDFKPLLIDYVNAGGVLV